uniref:Uncharacterized protein n=1 Tax=Lygus hesperus TaxID=30085 RepID=A0A0K8S698_LYGHE
MYQRNVSLASIERMSQIPEVKTNSIRRSDESLNFQLAQPVIPPAPNVISKAKVEESGNPESEKNYLETEIDSYTGLDFTNKQSSQTLIRPPTPPKPSLRAFTFGTTNPFVVGPTEKAPSNDLYTTINKHKSKPMVPPKPSSKHVKTTGGNDQTSSKRLSTTSLFDNVGEANGNKNTDDANLIQRVNSLPNLAPLQMVQVGNRLQPVNDIRLNRTIGYGIINKMRGNGTSLEPLCTVGDSNDVDYCDMIPESPPYINEMPNDSENVYEDVRISSPKSLLTNLQRPRPSNEFVSDILNKTPESDYTKMVSPISDLNFSFPTFSIYENLPVHSSSKVGINTNHDGDPSEEVLMEPPLQFSSSDNDGDQIIPKL